MNVNLSPEIEKRVKDELAAGQYQDMNQFVETAVQYLPRSAPTQPTPA
jgi:Arc/MetJ-type ribon-helix-helix transcriptional regulator